MREQGATGSPQETEAAEGGGLAEGLVTKFGRREETLLGVYPYLSLWDPSTPTLFPSISGISPGEGCPKTFWAFTSRRLNQGVFKKSQCSAFLSGNSNLFGLG